MGNKIHQGVLFKEKILKILQNPLNEGELRVRLLDIFNLQISEQSLIESLENTDIHNGIEKCPDNIKFIIQFIIESILVLSEKKTSLTIEEIVILKSLLMFLSRFIPIIYEQKYEEFCQKILWEDNPNLSIDEISGLEREQGFITPGDKKIKKPKMIVIKSDSLQLKENKELWYPYGIKMLRGLNNLLFFPGFTINRNISFKDLEVKFPNKVPYKFIFEYNEKLLWTDFFGNSTLNNEKSLLSNRLVLLQAIISVNSFPFFRSNSSIYYQINPYTCFFISPKNPFIIELLFSLLNTIIDFEENGILPYSGYYSQDQTVSRLGQLSAEFLTILLENTLDFQNMNDEYKKMIELQEVINYYINLIPQDSSRNSNTLETYLNFNEILSNYLFPLISEIKDLEYIQKIVINFNRLINNPINAKNSLFINSIKPIRFMEEILIITSKMVQFNPLFITNIFSKEDGLNFLTNILTLLNDKFSIGFKSGLFSMCLTFLLLMSYNRDFMPNLNNNLKTCIVLENCPLISGNYMDFIIIVITNGIITANKKQIDCAAHNFASILVNISPYIKNISKFASLNLLQLVSLFSDYGNILDNQFYGHALCKILKTIENILIYNPDKNQHLLYLIYMKKNIFYRIPKMKFSSKIIAYYLQSKIEKKLDKENTSINLEEEKKNSSNEENKSNSDLDKNSNQEEKELIIRIRAFWGSLQKELSLENIFSYLHYLNKKMDIIHEQKNEEEIMKIINEVNLVGVIGKPGNLVIDAITEFQEFNRILKEYGWFLICVKNNSLPFLEVSACKMLTKEYDE